MTPLTVGMVQGLKEAFFGDAIDRSKVTGALRKDEIRTECLARHYTSYQQALK